jgi:hypothetical protein
VNRLQPLQAGHLFSRIMQTHKGITVKALSSIISCFMKMLLLSLWKLYVRLYTILSICLHKVGEVGGTLSAQRDGKCA